MNGIFKSLKDKRVRYGAFSTLSVVFVIAALVAANLFVTKLDISYDLSMDKLYSISEETKELLAQVSEKITIYALFREGQEDLVYKQLLEEYPRYSKNVEVIYKDPMVYPNFVNSYAKDGETIPQDSIIVEGPYRTKIIPANDLETINYYSGNYDRQTVELEPQVTNAIQYVMQPASNIIYKITGHSEDELPETLLRKISLSNFEVKTLDLLSELKIPEDATMLFITTPIRDYSMDEAQVILEFLQNDGQAIFLVDYINQSFPNLEGILESYGVRLDESIIFEGSKQNMYPNKPVILLPDIVQHPITESISKKGYRNILPAARPIMEMELKKTSVKIEPIFVSSKSAFAKSNPTSQSPNYEEGDLKGPFNLAVTVTDSYYSDKNHETKLVVVGTSAVFDESVNMLVSGGNDDFITSALSWLSGKETSIYIKPKTAEVNTQMLMDDLQSLLIAFFAVIVLPGALFGTGIFVWLKRKNR